MPATDRPPAPTPAQHRAQLARVEADHAAAVLRRERLDAAVFQAEYAGRDAAALDVELARAAADIAELDARREELSKRPAEAPAPATRAPPPAPAHALAGSADDMLTTREAAAILRVTVKGLERMRAEGRGPPHKRIGRAVRYRRGDLR